MILTEKLPEHIVIDGMLYPINADFRVMVAFEAGIERCGQDCRDVIATALDAFYPLGVPVNVEKAVDQMVWFYGCGKVDITEKQDPQNGKGKRVYSFDDDSGYIFSAFLEQYQIDILKIDFLHWWIFRDLFIALREDTEFVKIMGYRAMKIDSHLPAEQKRFYNKMKRRYKLKDHRTEEQKESDMLSVLASFF